MKAITRLIKACIERIGHEQKFKVVSNYVRETATHLDPSGQKVERHESAYVHIAGPDGKVYILTIQEVRNLRMIPERL